MKEKDNKTSVTDTETNEEDEKELVKYAETLAPFVDGVPGYFNILTKDSKHVLVNQPSLQLTGFKSIETLFGNSYQDMHCKASECHDLFSDADKQVVETESSIKILSYSCFAGDNWTTIIGQKSPLRNKNKKLIGVQHFLLDVSDLQLIDLSRFLLQRDRKYQPKALRNQFNYVLGDNLKIQDLSTRQSECLFLLLRGRSAKAIANMLNISQRTVESHIEEVKIKFKCHNKQQLIEKSINEGYLNFIPESLIEKLL